MIVTAGQSFTIQSQLSLVLCSSGRKNVESSNEVITSDFVLGVQSIQNGNNMHKEVYKDQHNSVHLSIQKYTEVLL